MSTEHSPLEELDTMFRGEVEEYFIKFDELISLPAEEQGNLFAAMAHVAVSASYHERKYGSAGVTGEIRRVLLRQIMNEQRAGRQANADRLTGMFDMVAALQHGLPKRLTAAEYAIWKAADDQAAQGTVTSIELTGIKRDGEVVDRNAFVFVPTIDRTGVTPLGAASLRAYEAAQELEARTALPN